MTPNPTPDDHAAQIARDPEFERLVHAKKSLSARLATLMFLAYFGFIALLAWAPEFLSRKVGAASLGIPLGISVIVFAWILTGIYVRWANGAYDSMVARIKNSKS